jgi:acetylcholinesterase
MNEYIRQYFMPNISDGELATFDEHYPDDYTKGSPYETGFLNALSPQYKRMAAWKGDTMLQAPRRFMMQSVSGKQNSWAYCKHTLYFCGSNAPNELTT